MICSGTELLDEGVQDSAELRMQFDEESFIPDELDQRLRLHDIAADARIAIRIDLLGRQERRDGCDIASSG